jgi:SulP family sulfate permease
VATVTVFTDLAIAMIVGVIISALVFAWQYSKNITVNISTEEHGWKVRDLHGSLFLRPLAVFWHYFRPIMTRKKS